jgi:thymidine phosphorylase
MKVLRNEPDAPKDLREKSLLLAGRIIDFDPSLRGGAGAARARELLESGQALAAMERIIDAQGRNTETHDLGGLTWEATAAHDGHVALIDCYRLARIARLAGAPFDKGAGIDLFKKVGDFVRRGEPLYRVHACTDADFRFATALAGEANGYHVRPMEAVA